MFLKEIWDNKRKIITMSVVDMKSSFKTSILSYFWIFISPCLMIGMYLFSFFAAGQNIDTIELPLYNYYDINTIPNPIEFSRIGWLIIGVLTWTFVGGVIVSGSQSIRNYSWMITKVGSPLCVPPILICLSKAYVGFATILASWFIYMIISSTTGLGQIVSINILQLPLILFLLFSFICLYCLIISPLSAISRDILNLAILIPIFLQWITGVFLPLDIDKINEPIGIFFRINPFHFLLEGIRGSIMGTSFFWNDWISMTSFFSFFILFILLAGYINKRAKKLVVDLM